MVDKIFYPYRVCTLDAYVDHQLSLVTGFVLDKGITLEYEPTEDGSVTITSKNFEGKLEFNLFALLEKASYRGFCCRCCVGTF